METKTHSKNSVRACQNCKKDFIIEREDFDFYQKMKVPPPTFCPRCRYERRIIFRTVRQLFRGKEAINGKEIFMGISPEAGIPVYVLSYWNSDAWDAMGYGRDYDFSRPFFEQIRELFYAVPFPAKSMQRCINSEYSNACDDMKNAYLCFNATFMEECAYCVNGSALKRCFDMTSCYNDELCYENVRVDKSYHTFGSIMSESCINVWFSKNCIGCNNCFGCVNQRHASYKIFNVQYTKEEYFKKLESFKLDTWEGFSNAREKAEDFWLKFPIKYMLGYRNHDVLGEDIKDSKNVKNCYIVKRGENLKYVQDVSFGGASNSYDYTCWGVDASQIYECMIVGEQVDQMKFCFDTWPVSQECEYCLNCRRVNNCFACVGLKDKQYCIFNKQYTKEEYIVLVSKIKEHMNQMPFVDKRGNIYRYGEFFPVEFSVFAYNETLINDQFPSNKEDAEKRGFMWRESNRKIYDTTIKAEDLPNAISDINENILKEIIACLHCKKAYRIILDELNFLKSSGLPLPRYCIDCRFAKRQKFMVPPVLRSTGCMCAGENSSNMVYKNTEKHDSHGDAKCTNTFQTAYDIEKEIIYCEKCYQSEVY